jgi:putative membrane protein
MDHVGFAIAHHLLVFGLAAILAMEAALVRPGITAEQVRRVSRIDGGYGALAGAVLLVGTARVIWGGKGWLYYAENPWFWAKMGAFLAVGLMSIPPTLRFIRWRRVQAADSAAVPSEFEIAGARRWIRLQLAVFLLIPTFAAVMARFGA